LSAPDAYPECKILGVLARVGLCFVVEVTHIASKRLGAADAAWRISLPPSVFETEAVGAGLCASVIAF